MAEQAPGAEVRHALYELQRYLSDQVAPLMVADSVEFLLRCPPQVVASAIQGWVASQYRGAAPSLPVSDYLFHSVKKLHLISELELMEPEPLGSYLVELGEILVAFCPEEDREMLRANLGSLGQSESGLASSRVEHVHRQVGGSDAPLRTAGSASAVAAAPGQVGLNPRRFALLVDRLQHYGGGAAGVASASPDVRSELLNQVLTTAAFQSRTGTELEQHLHHLDDLGIHAGMGEVFRSLGRSLPGWAVNMEATEGVPAAPSAGQAMEAMRRIVSMAGDEEEGARRFGEMVDAAIEQFNEGALVQAATMFDLAERIVTETKLNPEILKSIRRKGQESLSPDQLRRFAEKPEKHALLRKVLEFFPGFTVQGLMGDLFGEPRRDRRKMMLALLEVHGAAARAVALERLEGYVKGEVADPEGFFQRNLIFLLRRIPRPVEVTPDKELELLTRFSKLRNPTLVVKEAVAALGQIKHEAAEQALSARLQDIEQMLLKGETGTHGEEELIVLLDRTVSALAGLGTSRAARAVFEHALKRKPQLGNTVARLEVLSGQDMSVDRDLVARFIGLLKDELPMKVLGFVVQQKSENALHVIRALSSTPAPAVRQVLEDIVQRFYDRDFAQAASGVLAGFGATTKPTEAPAKSFSGDVELFGLPNLLQTMSESQLTGTLVLADLEGETIGTIVIESGQIRICHAGGLSEEAAFYQLFEKPAPGTFTFQSQREGPAERQAEGPLFEIMPLVLEAVRRHDEFKQARALVPDDVRLKSTGTKPTRPTADEEPPFLREVWLQAASGMTPNQCEAALGVDSYRVRRLLAHWVEEGTLEAK